MFSQRCLYAIRLAVALARRGDAFVPLAEVGDALGMPNAFLAKAGQDLVHADVLISRRGPHGGVALARDASAIRLLDVVEAVDGLGVFDRCLLGLPGCGSLAPCPLHEAWVDAREGLRRELADTSLADAAGPGGMPSRLG